MKDGKVYCRLKELMATKGVSQLELSSELGIATTSISRLFHNTSKRIDLEIVAKLCIYFDCGISDLLEFKNSGDQ